METLYLFLWRFPALLMFHDFEEIILVGAWKQRNSAYLVSHRSRLTPYGSFVSTAPFACGVAEESYEVPETETAAARLVRPKTPSTRVRRFR